MDQPITLSRTHGQHLIRKQVISIIYRRLCILCIHALEFVFTWLKATDWPRFNRFNGRCENISNTQNHLCHHLSTFSWKSNQICFCLSKRLSTGDKNMYKDLRFAYSFLEVLYFLTGKITILHTMPGSQNNCFRQNIVQLNGQNDVKYRHSLWKY